MEPTTVPATFILWVCISQAALLLVALGLIGWLVHVHAKETRQLTARVAMLAGLHPHHAAPDTFLPGGVSKEVAAAAEAATPRVEPVEGYAQDGVEEDEKQDAREFVEMLRVKAAQNRAAKEYEQGLRLAAEQSQVGARIVTEGNGP